jgi:hypothetical protein
VTPNGREWLTAFVRHGQNGEVIDSEKTEPPPDDPEAVPIPYADNGRGLHEQLYPLPAAAQLSTQMADALAAGIARERLRKFRAAFGGATSRAVHLHQFDQALSAGIVAVLATMEVLLRQAMHVELSIGLGQRWFDRTDLFDYRTKGDIKRCKAQLGSPNYVQQLPPGKVIAGFSFGVWCNLLARGSAPEKNSSLAPLDYESTLWTPYLSKAFPYWSEDRSGLDRVAQRVRYVRNRVAHHEPVVFGIPLPGVFDGPAQVRLRPSTAIASALTLLGAVNKPAAEELGATVRRWPLLANDLLDSAERVVAPTSVLN